MKLTSSGLEAKFQVQVIDPPNYRETVFLAGTGRSGTTWVEDIINFDGSFRVLFEPFHAKKVSLLNEWNYRQYLRSEIQDERFLGPATEILSGRIQDEWIDQFPEIGSPRKRLIKDIRANLLLKWIKTRFPEVPIILLLRHPCAVAHSKLKLGWETHLHDFLLQDELLEDFLWPFVRKIEAAASHGDVFEKHIFLWCIENYVPLKQFSQNEIHVSFYEDVCVNPQKEIMRMFSFIGETFSSAVLAGIKKPSAYSRQESAIGSNRSFLGNWQSEISPTQIHRTGEILKIFGLEAVYGKENFPLVQGGEALEFFAT